MFCEPSHTLQSNLLPQGSSSFEDGRIRSFSDALMPCFQICVPHLKDITLSCPALAGSFIPWGGNAREIFKCTLARRMEMAWWRISKGRMSRNTEIVLPEKLLKCYSPELLMLQSIFCQSLKD